MKLARPQALLLLLAFGPLAGLVAFDISNEHFRVPNMISLSPRLLLMFEKTKTVCFVRFVVDVPATATVVYGPASAPNDIIRYPGEADTIDDRVAKMVAEVSSDLQKRLAHDIGKDPLYGTTANGAVPGQKLVFGQSDGAFLKINSFIALKSDLYTQWTIAWPEK